MSLEASSTSRVRIKISASKVQMPNYAFPHFLFISIANLANRQPQIHHDNVQLKSSSVSEECRHRSNSGGFVVFRSFKFFFVMMYVWSCFAPTTMPNTLETLIYIYIERENNTKKLKTWYRHIIQCTIGPLISKYRASPGNECAIQVVFLLLKKVQGKGMEARK